MPALARAHVFANAKAIELSLHRAERLVTLKKIDKDFLTKTRSLALQSFRIKMRKIRPLGQP